MPAIRNAYANLCFLLVTSTSFSTDMISLNESKSLEMMWNCVHNEMLMETIVVAKMSNKNLCVFKLFRPELFVAPDGDADKIGGDDDDGIDGIVGDYNNRRKEL
jgi:hypothetical protein